MQVPMTDAVCRTESSDLIERSSLVMFIPVPYTNLDLSRLSRSFAYLLILIQPDKQVSSYPTAQHHEGAGVLALSFPVSPPRGCLPSRCWPGVLLPCTVVQGETSRKYTSATCVNRSAKPKMKTVSIVSAPVRLHEGRRTHPVLRFG
jgi:hypothetical protein